MSLKKLKILPLGGLGEIGMNCMVLEWDDQIVLVDCGVQFPDVNYPGVEILTPDLSYVRQNAHKLKGVVMTHGHDDHIGSIPFLLMDTPVDIYCTAFPRGLLQNKLAEYPRLEQVTFHEIKPRKKFKVGPFTFEGLQVAHSIVEAMGLAIETPVGVIIHSGDFKHDEDLVSGDQTGFQAFEEYGNKGVRLLFSDSTNAERKGHTIPESQVVDSFEKIFAEQSGRLFVALFASNIRRIENLLGVAHRLGKKVAFAGRSMHSYTRLAHEQSTMKIPEDTVILDENMGNFPDKDVIVFCTGSQSEPGSALVRIAHGTHKQIHLRSGDTIILSSRFIPGNERAITNMIDQIYRAGGEVIYEAFHQIHVSGHGFQDELMMMLKAVRPECFIPVHGEYRHLSKHSRLAASAGVRKDNILIIENGQSVLLDEKTFTLGERYDLVKGVIVEGKYMDNDPLLFAKRRHLARTGIIYASFVRDHKSRKLLEAPVVVAYGVLYREGVDEREVTAEASERMEDLYPDLVGRDNWEELVKVELRRLFRRVAAHKPIVISVMQDA